VISIGSVRAGWEVRWLVVGRYPWDHTVTPHHLGAFFGFEAGDCRPRTQTCVPLVYERAAPKGWGPPGGSWAQEKPGSGTRQAQARVHEGLTCKNGGTPKDPQALAQGRGHFFRSPRGGRPICGALVGGTLAVWGAGKHPGGRGGGRWSVAQSQDSRRLSGQRVRARNSA